MCIRDRTGRGRIGRRGDRVTEPLAPQYDPRAIEGPLYQCCLLYTSDAADERSSVDLGGRRIIKKKKDTQSYTPHASTKKQLRDTNVT